ncbi:conserved hypothetical protein [uncultured Eubacteriales bacterium]|uniref:5'-deoxynucleotidase n=1 Tax=uncultured Eubacteriales bacterium TaxID=172733 RepID=A0A212J0P4_9FIRM|nr:conserved hypothetical protein [uncultured Eubacteriales bacterium]
MTPTELLQFLSVLEKLKCNTRHCWTSTGRHETVAAHSWRLAVMALLMKDELGDVDMEKVLRMCLIHDFGEAVTGDIPAFDKTASDEETETQAIASMLALLPEPLHSELAVLFTEMDALETPEAKVYKTLDKMEAVIQHNEAPLDTWTPLEHTLNLTYGEENASEFPYLASLRAKVRCATEEKLK